jgi:addiction module RelE/StbE family toxin
MIVVNIEYSDDFVDQLKRLPKNIIEKAFAKERIFRANPLHPSLQLHQLQGKLLGIWSISISGNYRIIFKRQDNGDIIFFSIGTHDIYKHL